MTLTELARVYYPEGVRGIPLVCHKAKSYFYATYASATASLKLSESCSSAWVGIRDED